MKIQFFNNVSNKYEISFKHEIKFSNINFSYNKGKNKILDNVTFSIKKGETIGIIGQSGAGKSTIVDILLGLLIPSDGSVLVDKINISDNISSWQKNIGYVPQSIYLIDDTIKKNIAFGLDEKDINIEKVNKSIRLAQLNELIELSEDGLDSLVGDRGVKLSGGQKQRIGIARALYRNPEILILDEATCTLDEKTEYQVINAILKLKNILYY